MNIVLEEGKYEYRYNDGVQCVFRYGEPWRDLSGDKFIYCMASRIEQLEMQLAEAKKDADAKQAEIDRLMIEFCPDEMTQAQWDEWAKHQKPVED